MAFEARFWDWGRWEASSAVSYRSQLDMAIQPMRFRSAESHLQRSHPMDTSDASDPLHQTIAAGLSELGMSDLPCRSTTFLIRDGYCCGRRFLFDEIEAIWLIAENVVRFYDEQGRLLKSVEVGTVEQDKAA